jgi:hypothetical protein
VISIVKARTDKSLLKNRNMTIWVKLSLFKTTQLLLTPTVLFFLRDLSFIELWTQLSPLFLS